MTAGRPPTAQRANNAQQLPESEDSRAAIARFAAGLAHEEGIARARETPTAREASGGELTYN